MSKTDEDTIIGLIRSVPDPVFIVIPNLELDGEELVKLYQSIETFLQKIEEKTEMEFEVMIESAEYFGGYQGAVEAVDEQKEEVEILIANEGIENEDSNQTTD